MGDFLGNLFSEGGLFENFMFPSFRLSDFLDIIIIAFFIYELMRWIRKTRAWVLFRGGLLIFSLWVIASVLQLNMVTWIFSRLFSIGILAFVVIFQPELRRALENLGTNSIFGSLFRSAISSIDEAAADRMVEAVKILSAHKTGALIVIEHEVPLGEYEQTGIPIDAEISSELLVNIFEKNTPLHDGAVIIRQNRILAATCYLPMSDNLSISKELGTRHRAALGMSEVSDALIIIVSEETGQVSMAQSGRLLRNQTAEQVKTALLTKPVTLREKARSVKNALKQTSGGEKEA